MWQAWTIQFLGAWLALAPIIGVEMPWAELNNFFVGILSALLSASISTRKAWVSWLGIAAGGWVAISSLFLFFLMGDGYLWNNEISGGLIFLSGLLCVARVAKEKRANSPALGSLSSHKVNNEQ
jgi:hypothetical protein